MKKTSQTLIINWGGVPLHKKINSHVLENLLEQRNHAIFYATASHSPDLSGWADCAKSKRVYFNVYQTLISQGATTQDETTIQAMKQKFDLIFIEEEALNGMACDFAEYDGPKGVVGDPNLVHNRALEVNLNWLAKTSGTVAVISADSCDDQPLEISRICKIDKTPIGDVALLEAHLLNSAIKLVKISMGM